MAEKKQKTKKRNSKKNKKQTPLWLMILIVVAAIFLFFYRTNPSFKAKVDNTVQNAINYVESILNPESEVQNQSKIPENTQNSSSADSQSQTEESSVQTEKTSESKQSSLSSDGKIILSENLSIPLCSAVNHAEDHERRDYKYYSICYRESYEQAEWSAYCLDDSELVKNATRSDDFRPDTQISTGSATLADYKGSGYDRGHLSPAADFAFSQEAMSETFYMSNMSPQAGSFNRGIWKDLEAEVREWAKKFGRVYVVSGPVLDESPENYATIGSNKVSVPKAYYKVLLAPLYSDDEDKSSKDDAENIVSIGFVFPNEKCEDSFFNYVTTVDEIENRTNIDFFNFLDDSVETKVESTYDINLWK